MQRERVGRGVVAGSLDRWVSMGIVALLLSAACAPSAKTVVNVTTGITGCPTESLAVFNYVKATRTWSAACGEKLYVCSDGRGDARCTEQQPETIDPERAARAKALLLLSSKQRTAYADKDISLGDWPTFAQTIATTKLMTDEQLADVDPSAVHSTGSADLDQAVRRCTGDGWLTIDVTDQGRPFVPQKPGEASVKPCAEEIMNRPDVAWFKNYPKRRFVLLPGVFEVKPIARPVSSAAAATPTEPAVAAPAASTTAAAAATPEVDKAVREWLDGNAANILACTGQDRSAILVNVSAEGKPEVSVRGATAGGPEDACVRSALSAPPSLAAGAAQVLHVVKSGS